MNLDTLLIGTYLVLTLCLSILGAHRVWLLLRFRWRDESANDMRHASVVPHVTVQLPMYNERTVAARLIRAVGALDYPRERLEIQVLDDSNDETVSIVDVELEHLRARGLDAYVIRRETRSGYKAGALAAGQIAAKGELFCVFDADFVPRADFLRRVIGAFDDPRVDMVQARWEHLNRDENWFTRAQAALLDGHFVITHKVRFDRDLFFHFNGTAGVWRRSAIERAGGWQHDTLTEDLDLSYRAQLAGSHFRYAAHVIAPAELPADIAAFKSQQTRWARGTVQVARKLSPDIATANVPLRTKLEAALHFASHAGHPMVLAVVLLLPFTVARADLIPDAWYLALLALCTPAVFAFYATAQRAIGRPLRKRVLDSALAVLLGIGMSWSLARAAFAGLRGDTGAFVRTPKRGDRGTRVYASSLRDVPGAELAFAAWAAFGVFEALRVGAWSAALFLMLYVVGFGWVGWMSVAHPWRRSLAAPAVSTAAERLSS